MESKIKILEDAFELLGLDPKILPDVSKLPVKYQKYVLSNYKLIVITEALNKEYSDNNGLKETWEPNWNDTNQYKYFPWFEVDANEETPSGFGFSGADYGNWNTVTYVGSRLCFPTSELAIYSAKQFEELHKENQLILK